jgi:methionyl aminopeptidase
MAILIKNDEAIKKIAIAGNIIYEIFTTIDNMDLANMRTIELNDKIAGMIQERGAIPAFLNYRGFPKSCCISLNDEVVHGIPDERRIKEGSLVKIDVGVKYQDYIADAARTYAVGEVSDDIKNMLKVTKNALKRGIEKAYNGGKISEISYTIQETVEDHNFSVVRELTGHGVGRELHEEPMIPNFVSEGPDVILKPGMVLAIEPMVNMGGSDVVTAKNGWTVLTKDSSLSCHYEDTIAILEKGRLNLTRVVES